MRSRPSAAGPLRLLASGRPSPLPPTDKSAPRPALIGQATAKAGKSVLDVPLAFRPSEPLAGWHAKVAADGQVVIDRDFSLVAP